MYLVPIKAKRAPKKPKHNSVVVYNGPSNLDGAPIIVIVSGLRESSANEKTGNMLQTWILRADIDPQSASKSGADSSICGNCPHRHFSGGACYVQLFQAPRSIYAAWKRGTIPDASALGLGIGRNVRIGSYGDPAAVPIKVWQDLLDGSLMHTGYSHQWRIAPKPYRDLLMASVDSQEEYQEARALGWRTFRVMPEGEVNKREFICPASAEAGYKKTCATCGACNGATRPNAATVVILVHGARAKRFTAI